ncbi:hypothetical protein AX16_008979 [Volvariella volvacea WC 439]|nr:hypothetical protein AX16_008979 [Volvariella volvacea WC 439]
MIPATTKALIVRKDSSGRKPVYYDAVIVDRPVPQLSPGQVLVKIGAAAFNHKDVWVRMAKYPKVVDGSVFGADGAGTVVASGDPNDSLVGQRVFLTPMRGWKAHPDGPESLFGIMGNGPLPPIGTFSQYVIVERDEVIRTPDHLDDVHAAAWPLAGLTAWRAAIVNAKVQPGDNVLITGIGGGVAIVALQLCVAQGANVYVTSSSQEKIDKAIALGAKGGVNYKDKNWAEQVNKLLLAHAPSSGGKTEFDSVVDSGGGNISGQMSQYLKHGGRIVCYGMTAEPKITFTMREVLKNQQLIGALYPPLPLSITSNLLHPTHPIVPLFHPTSPNPTPPRSSLLGSTMGSTQDLISATHFLSKHRIVPVVSHILQGLESAEEGFELIKRGVQFGKVVVKVDVDAGEKERAKL